MSQISQEVFDKIRARFSDIQMGDAEGKSVLDPDEAVFFEFNFDVGEDTLGSVVINLTESESMKVYFSANILSKADEHQSQRWFEFLQNLRRFAYQNMMNFEVKNINKQRLDKKDFEFMSKIDHAEALTMESKMYGTKKASRQKLGDAKVKVYHQKPVDEEKQGARSRNIKSVYIENADGERFKFGSKYLPGARAMARHVSNGGYPHDEVGSHIMEMVYEMQELREFVRKARKSKYQSEDAIEVIDTARNRYQALRETIRTLANKTGYKGYVEHFQPDLIEVNDDDIGELKERLTRSVFDDRLEGSLGAVGKAMKMKKQQQMQEQAQSEKLERLASTNEPIEVRRDPVSDQEMSRFMQQVKSSDMPKNAQFRGIVTKVVEELADRAKDNEVAVGLSRLDMNDPQDFKLAAKIATKFVKGQVKSEEQVRERDPMESYEARLSMLAEGTWALPDTTEAINRLVELVDDGLVAGENGENATSALYDLIGDDELFDNIEEAASKDGPETDVKPLVVSRLKELARMDPENFTNPSAHKMIRRALKEITKPKKDNGDEENGDEEKLDEKLSCDDDTGEWIDDFQKSDDKRFKGKSKEKRKDMALGAYYDQCKEDEELKENVSPKDFVKSLRQQGWSVYVSRADHGVENAYRLEFEKDGQEFEIIGKDDYWEVFTGPTHSGRGEEFTDLQSAFRAATANEELEETDEQIQEQIDRLYASINLISNAGFSVATEAKMAEVEALQKKLAERTRSNTDEDTLNEMNEDLEAIKKLAGVGSTFRTGTLGPGEDGYSVTPRSIIARKILRDRGSDK